MPLLDLSPDQLLTTTRAVRKRLDFSRPVEPEIIRECLEIALQAPSGSNRQPWHFVVVTDAEQRKALGNLYKRGFALFNRQRAEIAGNLFANDPKRVAMHKRSFSSGEYLVEHLHEVPVHLIPCFNGRVDQAPSSLQAAAWGSIFPAVWSFMLAARTRGLGTTLTALHLLLEEEAAQVLDIPYAEVTQAALIPVAYTKGTDFSPGPREPLEPVLHWDRW